ncbi:Uncharacterized protease yhbU precursor [Slackia heliotrinireducens]|uniref:Collagenase-like protease n=1 Tax=Slackia heliotrinireducens (strain ATCC 29202 / DSM 20476 / NCTC 11029 / RHS 1) TaxID=471855 RepID=C7N1S0_SLAHD|nr:U32 family peptidase C-terminal domain-containing protein [Slackia heliotrinireducens]ACV23361.1 collagenase-like protease [Slackia heliotrinireducens DSM 20476]VEH02611.1 Uncharacterized protease yhbU precursor [Slackia heliotrinireducens]
MAKMELLAPAGGWEQLEYAVHFGADAVYLASQRYGMRRRADNFKEEDLPRAIAFAHDHGVAVHVTVNTLMTDENIDDLPRYFKLLGDAGADAAIIADMGALAICREVAPHVDIHLSTQASCMNAASAQVYQSLGVKRVVLAREMNLDEIARMKSRLPEGLEIEAFAHGAMCMAYSGRCLISDYLTGRGANKGSCAQPCRWEYALTEPTRPGEYFPVEEDAEQGSFIMSSRDMSMLGHLDDLAAAGIDSIKIEGRAKGTYYVASVVNAYRNVLDGGDPEVWQRELETTSHRPYSTGFYYGFPGQNPISAQYSRKYQMVATVKSCVPADGGFQVRVVCRNRFDDGDTVEVLSPRTPVRECTVRNLIWHAAPETDLTDILRDNLGTVVGPDPEVVHGRLLRVGIANRTMEEYSFDVPFGLQERDIVRISRDTSAIICENGPSPFA